MRTARMVAATEARTDQERTILLATIRAAQAGDERAFEDLMLACERRVSLLAWRILGDTEDVKEATQQTFIRVFRHLGRYDEGRDFFGWLYRIAVNVCRDLDKSRRHRRFFFLPLENAAQVVTHSGEDDDVDRRDDLTLLTRAIDALPRKERLAVILREVEELPTDEVAAILGSSPATVRVQVSKARTKIRTMIERWRQEARR